MFFLNVLKDIFGMQKLDWIRISCKYRVWMKFGPRKCLSNDSYENLNQFFRIIFTLVCNNKFCCSRSNSKIYRKYMMKIEEVKGIFGSSIFSKKYWTSHEFCVIALTYKISQITSFLFKTYFILIVGTSFMFMVNIQCLYDERKLFISNFN